MTNDAERVSDIVARLRDPSDGWSGDAFAVSAFVAAKAADIIETQSKALAEARVVKPLEWDDANGKPECYSFADTYVGRYQVEIDELNASSFRVTLTGGIYNILKRGLLTIAEAKAAAQADYAARILSALTPTPENPNG